MVSPVHSLKHSRLVRRETRVRPATWLRLAVIGVAPARSQIVLRPLRTLLGDQHAEIADRLTAVLRALAADTPWTQPH